MDGYAPYCRHYRYENTCPEGRNYDTFDRWWYLEREYIRVFNDKHEYWETEGIKTYFDEERDKDILEYIRKFPKEMQGFLAYSAIMSFSHCPAGGIDFIFNYDKEIDFPI